MEFICNACKDKFKVVVTDPTDSELMARGQDAFEYHLFTEHEITITPECDTDK